MHKTNITVRSYTTNCCRCTMQTWIYGILATDVQINSSDHGIPATKMQIQT